MQIDNDKPASTDSTMHRVLHIIIIKATALAFTNLISLKMGTHDDNRNPNRYRTSHRY